MDVGKVSATSVITGSVPSLRKEPGLSSFPPEPEKTEPAQGEKDGRVELGNALAELQSRVQTVQRDLDFSVDDSTGDVVVKVVDRESGKVVRQFPSEEVLKLAEQLGDMQSLLFEAKA